MGSFLARLLTDEDGQTRSETAQISSDGTLEQLNDMYQNLMDDFGENGKNASLTLIDLDEANRQMENPDPPSTENA
jgi:hypothetical protein